MEQQFDGRFTVAVFLRGDIPWDEDVPVNGENVVVAAFMRETATHLPTYKSCVEGFRLYCGHGMMQLFNRQRNNTFIFVTRPPEKSQEEIVTSIALQQISGSVRRVCTLMLCYTPAYKSLLFTHRKANRTTK